MKIPKGCRRLRIGEVIQENDKIDVGGELVELKYRNSPLVGDFIGRRTGKYDIVFRRIKK